MAHIKSARERLNVHRERTFSQQNKGRDDYIYTGKRAALPQQPPGCSDTHIFTNVVVVSREISQFWLLA